MAVRRWPFEEWPEHVQVVLLEVGRAMGTRRRVHPSHLVNIRSEFGAILADHSVRVIYIKEGTRFPDEASHYRIEIRGSRYCGDWSFLPGDLSMVAKEGLGSA